MLIVVGIVGLLLVLIAPAFTTIKGGADFTSAVYGFEAFWKTREPMPRLINTYVFVGFAEVDSSVDPSVSPQITVGSAVTAELRLPS